MLNDKVGFWCVKMAFLIRELMRMVACTLFSLSKYLNYFLYDMFGIEGNRRGEDHQTLGLSDTFVLSPFGRTWIQFHGGLIKKLKKIKI